MPRININIEANLKKKLKSKLALEGKTITDWVTEQAKIYLRGGMQSKKKK